jgi:hypothetical protein
MKNRIKDVIVSKCGDAVLGKHIVYLDRVGGVSSARLQSVALVRVRRNGDLVHAYQLVALDLAGDVVRIEWYREGTETPWLGWPIEVARFKKHRGEAAA